MRNKPITIGIDGPAGAGKSTIAKALSARFDIPYLDTGAMYRAVGLYMLRKGIDLTDKEAIAAAVPGVPVTVRFENGVQKTMLDGEDVSAVIRTPEVSFASSMVSSVQRVRDEMVPMQQRVAEDQSVIMDGRDIGTKVLPGATVKIFLTADLRARAQRRFAEERAKDPNANFEDVLRTMAERDARDTGREASPLVKADDAVEVDTTALTLEQSIEKIYAVCLEAIG